MDDSALETLLGRVASGNVGPGEATDRLRGVGHVGDVTRVDTRQGERMGIPEVVEAGRKTTGDQRETARELLEGTGLAILTDVDDGTRGALTDPDAGFVAGGQAALVAR